MAGILVDTMNSQGAQATLPSDHSLVITQVACRSRWEKCEVFDAVDMSSRTFSFKKTDVKQSHDAIDPEALHILAVHNRGENKQEAKASTGAGQSLSKSDLTMLNDRSILKTLINRNRLVTLLDLSMLFISYTGDDELDKEVLKMPNGTLGKRGKAIIEAYRKHMRNTRKPYTLDRANLHHNISEYTKKSDAYILSTMLNDQGAESVYAKCQHAVHLELKIQECMPYNVDKEKNVQTLLPLISETEDKLCRNARYKSLLETYNRCVPFSEEVFLREQHYDRQKHKNLDEFFCRDHIQGISKKLCEVDKQIVFLLVCSGVKDFSIYTMCSIIKEVLKNNEQNHELRDFLQELNDGVCIQFFKRYNAICEAFDATLKCYNEEAILFKYNMTGDEYGLGVLRGNNHASNDLHIHECNSAKKDHYKSNVNFVSVEVLDNISDEIGIDTSKSLYDSKAERQLHQEIVVRIRKQKPVSEQRFADLFLQIINNHLYCGDDRYTKALHRDDTKMINLQDEVAKYCDLPVRDRLTSSSSQRFYDAVHVEYYARLKDNNGKLKVSKESYISYSRAISLYKKHILKKKVPTRGDMWPSPPVPNISALSPVNVEKTGINEMSGYKPAVLNNYREPLPVSLPKIKEKKAYPLCIPQIFEPTLSQEDRGRFRRIKNKEFFLALSQTASKEGGKITLKKQGKPHFFRRWKRKDVIKITFPIAEDAKRIEKREVSYGDIIGNYQRSIKNSMNYNDKEAYAVLFNLAHN